MFPSLRIPCGLLWFRAMLGIRSCLVARHRIALRCTVLMVGFAVAAPAAEPPGPNRQITTAPEVTQPWADAPEPYRTEIAAISKRHLDHYASSRLVEALAEARNGIALALQANRPRDEAEFLGAALYACWLLGLPEAGLDYGQRLLARADELNDDRKRSIGHRVLGTIFGQLSQLDRQREHTQQALAFAERAGDAPLRFAALNNLGNLLLEGGDLAGARRIHEEVLAYREKNNRLWDAAGSLTNLADVAEKAGELPRALELHERALAMRTGFNDRRGQVRSLSQVANILRQLGRHDEALARLVNARTRVEAIGGHELLNRVYSGLARVHEARGDYAAALEAERLATREANALAGERARIHAANAAAQFELQQKQQTIGNLAHEKQLQAAELRAKTADLTASALALQRADAMRIALGMVLVTLAIALGAVIVVQRSRLRAERRVLFETQTAREAAEEADRIKTRFLGIATHDIRAPLGNIVSLTESLRHTRPGAADHQEQVDLIGTEAQRVLCLVEDLLTTAALETGKLELHVAPLDLHEVLFAAIDSHRWQADAKRQTIAYAAPAPNTGVIAGDAARLHQVVSNLISNAIKFSPPGATITVALARTDHRVRLTVRDQGPGLSAADVARLAEPFQRLSAQPTAGHTSHGLGLSIVNEIARLHGGELRVESQPGDGATFVVELPVAPSPA